MIPKKQLENTIMYLVKALLTIDKESRCENTGSIPMCQVVEQGLSRCITYESFINDVLDYPGLTKYVKEARRRNL
jgi:hypothetical protein